MDGRFATGDDYRYGFNGMEKDDEIKGDNNSYDFGARVYDPRVARWHGVDKLAHKYPFASPYNFVLGMPIIAIDPDGKRVWIIIDAGNKAEHSASAYTREREIRASKDFDPTKDQVYVLRVDDFGTLQQKISEVVDDATENGYGKTVELSVYSHAGTDGPVGTEPTSGKYNLEKKTKNPLDRNQLSSEGWDAIEFNFDEEESIAAFYGCQAISFVERFAAYQDAAYVAGYGGRVGVSESATTWDANWYTSDGEDLYMWDGMGIGVFKRVPEELKTDINGYEIDPAWDPDWDEHYWDLKPQELKTKINFTTNVGITKNKDGKIVIYGKSNGSKEESKD